MDAIASANTFSAAESSDAVIVVEELTMSYDDCIIQKDINFSVKRNDIFIIMGNSGSGKSTLLRAMTGLNKPHKGDVFYTANTSFDRESSDREAYYQSFWHSSYEIQQNIKQQFGVMFQSGALFSSMTLLENISLRLSETTRYSAGRIRKIAALKLAFVGLKGFEHYYPAQISGGMRKRAAIARAMAMDPPILFFDEPSAGLDPDSSKLLDDLLLELRDSLGITMIVVTHELDSIYAIADNAIFLDHEQQTIIASGPPKQMLSQSDNPHLQAFLNRGKKSTKSNRGNES